MERERSGGEGGPSTPSSLAGVGTPNLGPRRWRASVSAVSSRAGGVQRRQRNVVVLGFSLVGKTALCTRFCSNKFEERYEPTYENSFSRSLTVRGVEVDLLIKDTQGVDGESLFRHEYGFGYHGYVLVYSITSQRSLDMLRNIHERLLNLVGSASVPSVLVGAKADLEAENLRQVRSEEGRRLAGEWGCAFVECSAKTGINVDGVFFALLDEIDRVYGPHPPAEGRYCSACLCLPCCLRADGADGAAAAATAATVAASGQDTAMRSPIGRQWDELSGEISPFASTTDIAASDAQLRAGRVLVALSLLAGLGVAALGGAISSDRHERGTDALVYVLLCWGVLCALASALGFTGLAQCSRGYLIAFGSAHAALIAAVVALWTALYERIDLLAHFAGVMWGVGLSALVVEAAAASFVFWLQRHLRALPFDPPLLANHVPSMGLYAAVPADAAAPDANGHGPGAT